ncbi:hypothetical protein FB45DRAFT_879042 [Roridomyces roridus]|uniref:Uncharacterized protein n=1 Tax=Roridomyces roridus TaxID=1738132 RepID=A0AAD7F6V4_9AGAR|nr:hypothetical protein FB45DRAFT_879042 [Roridomyces roridus]
MYTAHEGHSTHKELLQTQVASSTVVSHLEQSPNYNRKGISILYSCEPDERVLNALEDFDLLPFCEKFRADHRSAYRDYHHSGFMDVKWFDKMLNWIRIASFPQPELIRLWEQVQNETRKYFHLLGPGRAFSEPMMVADPRNGHDFPVFQAVVNRSNEYRGVSQCSRGEKAVLRKWIKPRRGEV